MDNTKILKINTDAKKTRQHASVKEDHPAWLLTELAMFVSVMLLQYCFQSLKIPTNIHQP